MTDEEERRKQTYDERSQAIAKAMAVVFFDGDEDAAWRAVFEIADRPPLTSKPKPTATRLHLKAAHQ